VSRVLVLLASYNGEAWIREQIESVLAQKDVEVAVLVGDDCSQDNTMHIVKEMACDPRISILKSQGRSGGAGQNFLRLLENSDLSGFDFVAFCDQDDIWLEHKLARAITEMDKAGVDGYSAPVLAFWPDGREQLLLQNRVVTDLDYIFEGAGQGCTFTLRQDFALRVRDFLKENRMQLKSVHYHDWLVYSLARAWGRGWIFDDMVGVRYRQHGNNDTGARRGFSGILKRLGLLRSGWYCNQVDSIVGCLNAAFPIAALPVDFQSVWFSRPGISRRVRLSHMLLVRGRRRSSDRLILFASALAGWI